MMELVGLDKRSIHLSNEGENNVRSDKVYSEPSKEPNDTSEKSKDNKQILRLLPNLNTSLVLPTYKPGQNVPEGRLQGKFCCKTFSQS